MAGLTFITGIVNSLSTYWMEKITKGYIVFHVLALVSCCVALLVMAQPSRGTPKHTADYVFTNVNSSSGWSPLGFSFLFGFLSVSWTMTDFDATAHISEEIIQPEIKAPWAISTAMLFTYLAGWLYTIVLCFTMGDPEALLASPMAQPVAQIFYNTLGPAGGIVYTLSAFVILKFVTFTAMQALGRTLFAFSRDRLLPLTHVWTRILPLTGTPVLAVWLAVAACIAINLIGLGSYTAIAGVYNVCAVAFDWSYGIPIACKLLFNRFEPGPWTLGPAWVGTAVNVWACVWTVFITVIFFMPTALPVTPDTMNYAVVYFFGILAFCAVYWVFSGRRHYTGPVVDAKADEEVREEKGGQGEAGVMA